MKRSRIDDAIVGTIGDAAGTLVDPRRGLGQLKSSVSGKPIALVLAGLFLGLLISRRRRG
ncbi:MYXO-CTERM sorting domain-containing protein [Micromonospora sp. NPDC047620]|uniref:MYXO-CTERM sorting domain-containing protein n=1 Tax=Micromonospora sp. NPDC047620 TaxID=3364251 RepID=UPI00371938A7